MVSISLIQGGRGLPRPLSTIRLDLRRPEASPTSLMFLLLASYSPMCACNVFLRRAYHARDTHALICTHVARFIDQNAQAGAGEAPHCLCFSHLRAPKPLCSLLAMSMILSVISGKSWLKFMQFIDSMCECTEAYGDDWDIQNLIDDTNDKTPGRITLAMQAQLMTLVNTNIVGISLANLICLSCTGSATLFHFLDS
jgi:hypothetical protein